MIGRPLLDPRTCFPGIGIATYLNLYDQGPRDVGRGAVHHLGIHTENLERLVAHMRAHRFAFRKGITNAGAVRYVMAAAPDGVLLELFETA